MKKEILVVKYGSSSLSGDNGTDYEKINYYAQKLSQLANKYQIVIITSGAVVAGKTIIGHSDSQFDSSIYAMVGSAAIVMAWQEAFWANNINVGQILVTHNDIQGREEGGRLRQVIHDALDKGIIPVINENDVLSDVELAKLSYGGDNDGLASKIAIAIGANELVLLTNVDGLLDGDSKVVRSVDINNHVDYLSLTNGKSSAGRGGMASKIEAAVSARQAGVSSHIGNANADYQQLLDAVIGTHFE